MEETRSKLRSNVYGFLIVGLVVFGFFGLRIIRVMQDKNDVARQKVTQDTALERERLHQQQTNEEDARRRKEIEKAILEATLQQCLSEARLVYEENWAVACRLIATKNWDARQNCINLNEKWDLGLDCVADHPVDKSEDCALPSSNAKTVNTYHKEARDECFKHYKTE